MNQAIATFSLPAAPITAKERSMLARRAGDIPATAKAFSIEMTWQELESEKRFAQEHFELGCWLYYYRRLIGLPGATGFVHRLACAAIIFQSGFTSIKNDQAFTVFGFGERQFDTIFEMGDGSQVVEGLRQLAASSPAVAAAFAQHGWPINPGQ